MRNLLLTLSLLCFIFIAGCSSATPVPEPTLVLAEEPTSTPEPEPTAVVKMVDYCVDCHTDKEQLVATVKPVVESEGESSGVG